MQPPPIRQVTCSGSHGSFLSSFLVPVCSFSCFLSWRCLLSIQIRVFPYSCRRWGSKRRRRRRKAVGEEWCHPPTSCWSLSPACFHVCAPTHLVASQRIGDQPCSCLCFQEYLRSFGLRFLPGFDLWENAQQGGVQCKLLRFVEFTSKWKQSN